MAAKGEVRQLLTGRAVIWSDPNAKYEFDIEIKKPDGSDLPSVDESGYFLDTYPLTKIQVGQTWNKNVLIVTGPTAFEIAKFLGATPTGDWIWEIKVHGKLFSVPEDEILRDYQLQTAPSTPIKPGLSTFRILPPAAPPAPLQIMKARAPTPGPTGMFPFTIPLSLDFESKPVAKPSKNKCPLCGQPAYIGFSTVECETPGCKNAKPIQRPQVWP